VKDFATDDELEYVSLDAEKGRLHFAAGYGLICLQERVPALDYLTRIMQYTDDCLLV